MWISPELYLKRITQALEKTVAPEIESDLVRGQVFAVISLLQQLAERIAYKPDLIAQEIQAGGETLRSVISELAAAGSSAPGELQAFLEELDRAGADKGMGALLQVEEKLCAAIDFFFAARRQLAPETAARLDRLLRDYLTRQATRELGLTKPPNLEKISRSKKGG